MSKNLQKDLYKQSQESTVTIDEDTFEVTTRKDGTVLESYSLLELPNRDVQNEQLREIQHRLDELRDEELGYQLDINDEYQLFLDLPDKDLIVYEFYDEDGHPDLREILEKTDLHRDELLKKIEKTKMRDFSSDLYVDTSFTELQLIDDTYIEPKSGMITGVFIVVLSLQLLIFMLLFSYTNIIPFESLGTQVLASMMYLFLMLFQVIYIEDYVAGNIRFDSYEESYLPNLLLQRSHDISTFSKV